METESQKTLNIYDIKNSDNISIISDISVITGMNNQFELIEKYNNKKRLKYIYTELSLAMFVSIMDREDTITDYVLNKYTKNDKKECYIKVKSYCESLLRNRLTLKQTYIQNKCYRYYTKKMSLQNLPNEIRGFLCDGEMTDIDIKNGQPIIIYWLCKRYDIECSYLEKYVRERDNILEITKLKKIDYIISINNKKPIYGKNNDFYKMYDKEMKLIQNKLYNILIKEEEYNNIINMIDENKRVNNLEGCFINRVYFKHETEIIMYLMSLLRDLNYEIASYIYDGVMIYGNHYGNKDLEKRLTTEVIKRFDLPYNFELVFKTHSKTLEIPDDWDEEEDEEYYDQIYLEQKKDFEKTFFKLNTSPIRYVQEIIVNNCKDLSFYKKTDLEEYLVDKYQIKSKKYNFYKRWRIDPNKRSYNNIVFEPDIKKFNKDSYNFYSGYDNYDENIECIDEDKSKFLILLKYVCNDKNIYDIFKLWIHHIITKPYKKTNVGIVLYSKHGGVGKNAIVDGIIELIGKKYRVLLNKIEELDKTFNSNFCNKFFCYGDEIKTNAKNFSDEVKKCITRPEENYERKNIDAITISDYKNYLFTTNNKNAFKIEEKERRLLMVESPLIPYAYDINDSELNNKLRSEKFYSDYYEEIHDPVQIKKLFKYFYNYKMDNEELKNFEMGKSSIIMTKYKKELEIEQTQSYIKYIYCNTEYLSYIKKIYSRDLYEKTIEYAKKNYMSSNYTITDFGLTTNKYLKPFKKRDTKGIYFEFPNEEILLEHLRNIDDKYYKFIFEEGKI